ncbi:unnamed protein product [Cuscuta campestris]|uniref:Retrotransposon gag domain-containing protein n=1 Tax=Cuscuta campestris TaxID=132261 RepID=A0A484M9Q6_9ASTE|nr:unnamed protein product [Cuscuta campestris]
MTISAYYTKLKKHWETLQELSSFPTCECGKVKECTCAFMEKWIEIDNRNKLEFLMRLNDEYDATRGQILGTEPLPSLSKAFYIIHRIEAQKNITRSIPESGAFFVNNELGRSSQHKDRREDRRNKPTDRKFCKYCKSEGHLYEQCFERVGYPDWYKGKKYKKTGNQRVAAHVNLHERIEDSEWDTPLETNGSHNKMGVDQELVSAICNEVVKMFKGKAGELNDMNMVSANSAGMDLTTKRAMASGTGHKAVFDLLGAPIQLAVRKCAERFPLFQEYITIMAKHAERSEDSMIGAMGDAGVLLAGYGIYKVIDYRHEKEFLKRSAERERRMEEMERRMEERYRRMECLRAGRTSE